VLTGRELCELLGIDHDEIVAVRSSDQRRNLEYFISELLKIIDNRKMIIGLLRRPQHDDPADLPPDGADA
jgi:hypothetical protein